MILPIVLFIALVWMLAFFILPIIAVSSFCYGFYKFLENEYFKYRITFQVKKLEKV